MKRRKFIQYSSLIMASAGWPGNFPALAGLLDKVGIQLFSLPKLLEQDLPAALNMLQAMGYRELEFYGPYPFSVTSVQERWKALAPRLGFSGSGFFGLTPNQIKDLLTSHNLKVPSAHTDLETLETRMDQLAEAATYLGNTYVTLPAIPDEVRQTLDDYLRIAERFNRIGENALKHGLKFAYHNHGYGLQPKEGKIPFQMLLDSTDPQYVFLEMDIFWTTAGGADPVEYLESYPGRYHLMHLKDMKEKRTFAGDGGDASQWMALFPYMTTAGDGVLELPTIISKAKASGVKHFFVEQDMVSQPEIALKRSFDYLGGS